MLSLLGADKAARRGLRAVLREGRRCGLDTVTFAGVSLSSSAVAAGTVQMQRSSGSSQQANGARKPRRKSDARRERDAEKYREKRLRKKLFAALRIINTVMQSADVSVAEATAAGAAVDNSVQFGAQQHQLQDQEELPQFREELAPDALLRSQCAQQPESRWRGPEFRPQFITPAAATAADGRCRLSGLARCR